MKTFRFETVVNDGIKTRTAKSFVDWYDGETEEEARQVWDEDLHRYGLPLDQVTVTVREATATEREAFQG